MKPQFIQDITFCNNLFMALKEFVDIIGDDRNYWTITNIINTTTLKLDKSSMERGIKNMREYDCVSFRQSISRKDCYYIHHDKPLLPDDIAGYSFRIYCENLKSFIKYSQDFVKVFSKYNIRFSISTSRGKEETFVINTDKFKNVTISHHPRIISGICDIMINNDKVREVVNSIPVPMQINYDEIKSLIINSEHPFANINVWDLMESFYKITDKKYCYPMFGQSVYYENNQIIIEYVAIEALKLYQNVFHDCNLLFGKESRQPFYSVTIGFKDTLNASEPLTMPKGYKPLNSQSIEKAGLDRIITPEKKKKKVPKTNNKKIIDNDSLELKKLRDYVEKLEKEIHFINNKKGNKTC